VKPHAISVFADISMAIGDKFEKYAGVVLGILQQASTVRASNQDDEGEIEYINTLRVSILEAYTGIIHVSLFLVLCLKRLRESYVCRIPFIMTEPLQMLCEFTYHLLELFQLVQVSFKCELNHLNLE